MNYLEASTYLFENAEQLITQNKVMIGLHYTNKSKPKGVTTFLVMKPFKKNEKYAYRLHVVLSHKLNKPLHLRDTRNFTVKQDRYKKFAELQPVDIAQLNYQVMPLHKIDGRITSELVDEMLQILNIDMQQIETALNHKPVLNGAGEPAETAAAGETI